MASLRHLGAALRFDEPQLGSTALSKAPFRAGHRFRHNR